MPSVRGKKKSRAFVKRLTAEKVTKVIFFPVMTDRWRKCNLIEGEEKDWSRTGEAVEKLECALLGVVRCS